VRTESVSTRTAGVAVGLRLDSARLGGFRARVADAHAPAALPHAVERMTLLIDSPHARTRRFSVHISYRSVYL
jgi:hypothetical protein